MTSHQGSAVPFVGPPQPVSLFNGASPTFKSKLQNLDIPYGHVSVPNSKKQGMEEDSHDFHAETIRIASSVSLNDDSMSIGDTDGNESGPPIKYSDHSSSKRPSLFPVRRRCCKHQMGKSRQQGTNLAIERAAMRHDVQTRAYVAEVPNSAPRYQTSLPPLPNGSRRAVRVSSDAESADFFPWSGHHPEDMLNELTTRNGFYDKIAASQNESLTARPSVMSSLKNKSGLQTLSSLFSSALNQRERHGTITAASTFKPPPRVTLTDTKKEIWLKDLADSAIPLRRLSRTIPHGIRGKILLDHCLSKGIPIPRAIWLVKCVGANEIRACKRKGTSGTFAVGGEVKWIKDWTANVEQFLESIINRCGCENWKENIDYGLRLVSFIHVEHLLDRDEYYRWLIDHLETSNVDDLPIWLLVMNIHKEDLLRYRLHATRLTNALLMQLSHVQKPAHKVTYDIVSQELLKECRALLTAFPDCFLLPRCWKANKDVIQNYVVSEDKFLQSRFDEVAIRNEKVENRVEDEHATTSRSPEKSIIVALDSLVKAPDYSKIAKACLTAAKTSDELVKTCLHWASSTYRCGRYRIYAAARLLRIWSNHSIDLQKPVLDFLALGKEMPNVDWADFNSLCAELVSSGHLSVGRYCQWLMARGALGEYRKRSSGDLLEVQLLREVPLHHLPDHILNLRRSLLTSIGISTEHEDAIINVVQVQIAKRLPVMLPKANPAYDGRTDYVDVHALSRTLKSAIARWIQDSISCYTKTQKPKEHRSLQEPYLHMSEQDFKTICEIFEDLEEYVIFVDILCALVATAENGSLLTAITNTVNYHFDIFHSIGTTKYMFRLLFNQRKLSTSQAALQSSFTHALHDLGLRLPDMASEVRSLRKDDLSSYSKQSVAAPSPISDNMVDVAHFEKSTFFEEMDQILVNGTTMDRLTQARCFGLITDHLEKSWNEATAFSYRDPELLARLRDIDKKSFDALATPWLESLLDRSARPRLSLVLIPLICHDVCTLGAVVGLTVQLCRNRTPAQGALVAFEILQMLTSEQSEIMQSFESKTYRVHQQLHSILQTHFESIVSLVQCCVQAVESTDGLVKSQAQRLLRSDSFESFMRLLVSQMSIEDKPIAQHSPNLRSALKNILSQDSVPKLANLTIRQQISHLLDSVSDFNKSFSQLSLEIIIESPPEIEQNIPETLAEVLIEKLAHAPQSRVTLWSHLLSNLQADSALPVHEQMVKAVMSGIRSEQTYPTNESEVNTEYLLEIAMTTSSDVTNAVALSSIEQVLECLSKLCSSLLVNTEGVQLHPGLRKSSNTIHTLLRFLNMYQATILDPKFSQMHLTQICLSLCCLYLHTADSSHISLANDIFDILAIMSDALSQDSRSQSVQTFLDCQGEQDPRVRFIFGDSNTYTGGEWLRLVLGAAPVLDAKKEQPQFLRRWEMMQDTTPVATENDTSLSLTLFAARKSVL